MSSNWIFNARRYNLDFQSRFQRLQSAFNAKVADDNAEEGEDLQTRTEGGIGKSYLKFCDSFLASTKLIDDDDLPSEASFEPDLDTNRLWVEFDSIGGAVDDYSTFGHTAKTYGINRIDRGIDYGYVGSVENVFDGRSCYAQVQDHDDIKFSNVTSGFSLLFRFIPYSLSLSGGSPQVVACKKDVINTDWWSFQIHVDGSAAFNMKKSDMVRSIQTPTSTIVSTPYDDVTESTARYDVAVTWDQVTTTLKLFINNTLYSTVSGSFPSGTQVPANSLNYHLTVGRWADLVAPPTGEKYPLRADSKLYHGAIQGLKYFKEKVLTDAEVLNHYTNKVTIADVPFSRAAFPGTLIPDV